MCIERNKNKEKKKILFISGGVLITGRVSWLSEPTEVVWTLKNQLQGPLSSCCASKKKMHFLYLCLNRSPRDLLSMQRWHWEHCFILLLHYRMQMRTWAGLLTWHYHLQHSAGTNVNHAMWFRAYQHVLVWFIAGLSLWCQYHGLCGQLRKD